MELAPGFETFESAWARGENQLVTARLAADLDTPVSLMLKLAEAGPMSVMLESVTGGEVRGRYSIVAMKPDLVWRCRDGRAELNRSARWEDRFEPDPRPPLESLRALIAESRIAMPEGVPPVAAGLFGYLGYDMIRLVEHLPATKPDPIGVPDAMLMRPTVVAVLDGVKGEVCETIRGVEGVRGIEKCRARSSGGRHYLEIHVEVDPLMSVREAHAITGKIKAAVRERHPRVADVLLHVEPWEAGTAESSTP